MSTSTSFTASSRAAKKPWSQSIWNPQVWPVKLMIPVAGLLLLLQGIVRLVSDIRVLMGLPNDEAVYGKQASDEPSH